MKNVASEYQPEQQDVPKVLLLLPEDLPAGFMYPPEFLFLVGNRLVFFPPWQLLFGEWVKVRFDGLKKRYPNRQLVPFARRFNSDDVACWEGSDKDTVVIVHDFASTGWEDQNETYPGFWDWYRAAINEMINFEKEDR